MWFDLGRFHRSDASQRSERTRDNPHRATAIQVLVKVPLRYHILTARAGARHQPEATLIVVYCFEERERHTFPAPVLAEHLAERTLGVASTFRAGLKWREPADQSPREKLQLNIRNPLLEQLHTASSGNYGAFCSSHEAVGPRFLQMHKTVDCVVKTCLGPLRHLLLTNESEMLIRLPQCLDQPRLRHRFHIFHRVAHHVQKLVADQRHLGRITLLALSRLHVGV
mmetsp:Transcript_47988/g.127110  ORF Transcript_47988/g.127110 Transcript_47988/m.127110 type:complete len:225 (+) Transcript_47988:833-1507(+)